MEVYAELMSFVFDSVNGVVNQRMSYSASGFQQALTELLMTLI